MAEHKVMTEHETLAALLAGKSISRFGDGEFKLAMKAGPLKQQHNDKSLVQRLLEILAHDGTSYMIGIPRRCADNPKDEYWEKMQPRYEHLLREDFQYASSLISRPDNAPWIDNDEYYEQVARLWQGRRLCYVWGGSRKSFTPSMFRDVGAIDVIQSLPEQAWKDRGNILKQLDALATKPDLVIMALGPAATALVPDITSRGIQAIDIGHLGAWMRAKLKAERQFESMHDFVWPNGAEEYGGRYLYRTRDLEVAINKCPKRRSVVQAGGHVGVWPKHLSKYFGQVYTFEPELKNFLALNLNCPENHIFRFQAALGSEHKMVDLTLHPNNIGGHHVNGGTGWIPQFMIDDLALTDCDLIVLDIEGSELAAVQGAQETIKRCRPVLHLEMRGHIEKYNRGTTDQLKDLLEALDYKLQSEVNNDSVYVPK